MSPDGQISSSNRDLTYILAYILLYEAESDRL